MNNRQITHVGFSDESNWNKGRFRSIGLVTCHVDASFSLGKQLHGLLTESGISGLRWSELDGAKKRFAACKICKFIVDNACHNSLRHIHPSQITFDEGIRNSCLRVDVLIWDTNDSRHDILGRDDVGNLQRMYYHLFRNVMRNRWPKSGVWRFYPDKNTAIRWDTIQACLESKSYEFKDKSIDGSFSIQLRREFNIEEIQPITETDPVLISVADLFAGMAVYSRERFKNFESWVTKNQTTLSVEENNRPKISRRDEERFQVLNYFNSICKKSNLGVSLKRGKGLWTPNPENPINFWLYEPQHPNDKAPLRE